MLNLRGLVFGLVIGLSLSAGVIVATGSDRGQAARGGSHASSDVRDKLIGTWRLRSTPIRDQHGDVVGSLYKQPVGKLTYTRRGDVWAFTGERHRTSPSDPSLWYTGALDVRKGAHKVVHHVRFASIPQLQGTDLVRRYKLRGDRLILSASAGSNRTVDLHWRRAGG
jgi:hypothetical protein